MLFGLGVMRRYLLGEGSRVRSIVRRGVGCTVDGSRSGKLVDASPDRGLVAPCTTSICCLPLLAACLVPTAHSLPRTPSRAVTGHCMPLYL
jgi:hypothetical protein